MVQRVKKHRTLSATQQQEHNKSKATNYLLLNTRTKRSTALQNKNQTQNSRKNGNSNYLSQ